jgi:hypothetical protein
MFQKVQKNYLKKIKMKKVSSMEKIISHEKECAIRYENIEKRLEDGSKRFDRLELMLWGVYPFIVGALVVSRYLS